MTPRTANIEAILGIEIFIQAMRVSIFPSFLLGSISSQHWATIDAPKPPCKSLVVNITKRTKSERCQSCALDR